MLYHYLNFFYTKKCWRKLILLTNVLWNRSCLKIDIYRSSFLPFLQSMLKLCWFFYPNGKKTHKRTRQINFKPILTLFCLMDCSSLINWTSQFFIWWVAGVFFHFYLIFDRKSLYTNSVDPDQVLRSAAFAAFCGIWSFACVPEMGR